RREGVRAHHRLDRPGHQAGVGRARAGGGRQAERAGPGEKAALTMAEPTREFKPPDAFVSPRFGQSATFMRLRHSKDAGAFEVALLGIPFDGGTSYRTGARF